MCEVVLLCVAVFVCLNVNWTDVISLSGVVEVLCSVKDGVQALDVFLCAQGNRKTVEVWFLHFSMEN